MLTNITLNLNDNQIDALNRAVVKLYKDGIYYNKHYDELYGWELIGEIGKALRLANYDRVLQYD